VTTRGGTLAALLAALGRPSWWLLALAGFLVRGGIVLFVLAVVHLPSPLALSNVLGPIVTPLYLGQVEPRTLVLIVGGAVLIVGWLVLGSWFAGATEVALIRDARRAATEEGLPDPGDITTGRHGTSRAAAAHLVAQIPAAFVVGIGSIQIFDVAYRELVNPSDTGPIVERVVAGASGAVVAIVVAWVLGEIVGGMAVRRVVLGGEPVLGAVARAAADLARRPIGGLLAPLVTTAVLAVDLAAVLTVVTIVWSQVRAVMVHPGDQPLATGVTLVTFGAAWCLALLVTGMIDAWRSAAMTFETERRFAAERARRSLGAGPGSQPGPSGGGTFGASLHRRPGEWSADERGGSL
jgi:hypothetical protein